MHYNPEYLNPIDNEVGRLARFMPRVDTSCFCSLSDAYPEKGWTELSLKRSSDLIDLWEQSVPRFPTSDRSSLEAHIEDARELYELRNTTVHGRWWPVDDADEEFYMVEKVLTKTQARKETGRADWSDPEYPARWMPMNLATVARTLRMAKLLHRYFDKDHERWEAHFAAPAGHP